MNAVMYTGMALLLLAGLANRRNLPMAWLCATFLVTMTMGMNLPVWQIIALAGLIDGLTCAAMTVLYIRRDCMCLWAVGFISVVKSGASLAQYALDHNAIFWGYAILINAGFVLQVVIAGGLADGMVHRIGDMFRRTFPVRYQLLRNGKA